jgi:signal transduction histidine kinase
MLRLKISILTVMIAGVILLVFGGYLLLVVHMIIMDVCDKSMLQYLLEYKKTFIFSIPVVLFCLALGGWFIAHRILKPINVICQIAEKISVRDLSQRIPRIDADNELSRLVKVINRMLDRLEKSFYQTSRFTADAAHELQTPLTILQGVLDNAIQQAIQDDQETQLLVTLSDEVQRLKSIVRKLLILAQADVGHLHLRLENVNFSELVSLTVEDVQVIAPHLIIHQDIMPNVMVKADYDLLNLVIQNLSTNAIKYNTEEGTIVFKLTIEKACALFYMSNTGVPISKKDQANIFNRFFRVDGSHSKRIHGAGLGLSLAREIVISHQGDLMISESSDELTTFLLKIPCHTYDTDNDYHNA